MPTLLAVPKAQPQTDMMTSTSALMGKISSRGSHDSTASGSNGLSISPPTSNSSDEACHSPHSRANASTHGSRLTETGRDNDELTPVLPFNDTKPSTQEHVIHLSSIEHCMPRAYIRICLAYRLPETVRLEDVIMRLRRFARRIVDSKPYLAGHLILASNSSSQIGLVEIRYTEQDLREFPEVQVQHLSHDKVPYSYDDLDAMGLPPSVIKPELVSALPEGTDDDRAPVFRMQANIVRGGLIVSVYLHHCISDGVGLGLLVTGSVLQDDFTFERHPTARRYATPCLNERLETFAKEMSSLRRKLSRKSFDHTSDRSIQHKKISWNSNSPVTARPAGRGCVVAFSRSRLEELKALLEIQVPKVFMSQNDVLQALLWHHMTIARKPSLVDDSITTSKLLIPVNIRNKLKEPLSESYFGAAVDFATAQMSLAHLSEYDSNKPTALAETALAIRHAISQVDENYIRQVIALASLPDPSIDVRDLMGSNMNRATGADMYITSWEKLGLYDATLEMGLGKPDWVRKPWSKDPGSCIVLPNDSRKPYLEAVVQMTKADMERLLADEAFMKFVTRVVD